jgi:hypothetical protein
MLAAKTKTSEMSLILNFLTEISIIEGNPQTLPQIRIDDVEAESCLNVINLSQSARLIIICRLGTCVRSRLSLLCNPSIKQLKIHEHASNEIELYA